MPESEEEIKRYMIEDGLSEIKRSVALISRGELQQKLTVYKNLPKIVK